RGSIAAVGNGQQDVAQRFAEQAASGAVRAGADASRAATLNTAGEQAITGMGMSSNLRGQEQGRDVANALARTIQEIMDKKSDLADKRAGLVADTGMKLRQNEFNNLITVEGLGLDREKLEQSALEANARIGETERHNRKMERTASKQAMLAD